jgi:hypothetical protein
MPDEDEHHRTHVQGQQNPEEEYPQASVPLSHILGPKTLYHR